MSWFFLMNHQTRSARNTSINAEKATVNTNPVQLETSKNQSLAIRWRA
jgi:hypothetical protein